MTEQPRPETGPRRALVGFVEGAVTCLVVMGLIRFFRVGAEAAREWPQLAAFSVGAGLVSAIGRGLTGRPEGATRGGLLGLLGGGLAAAALPEWNLTYKVGPPPGAGEEFSLAGPGLDGKTVDVADYRGKVVLVDFWATWCGPCIAELPNVESAYEKYHADGFEVIAVSLDRTRDRLEKFVGERKLPWPQIFFDEEGKRFWSNPLVKEHKVGSIPATFLLDRDGKVAATNLRGGRLEEAVAHLLGKGEGDGALMRVAVLPMTLYLSTAAGAVGFALAGALVQRGLSRGPRPANPPGRPA